MLYCLAYLLDVTIYHKNIWGHNCMQLHNTMKKIDRCLADLKWKQILKFCIFFNFFMNLCLLINRKE